MNIRPIGLLLALVSTMAVIACSAVPTPVPAPSGPLMIEEEAIAVVIQHLQSKIYPPGTLTCWFALERLGASDWSADYDPTAYRWDIGLDYRMDLIPGEIGWSVYERTGSIVATGSIPYNQHC